MPNGDAAIRVSTRDPQSRQPGRAKLAETKTQTWLREKACNNPRAARRRVFRDRPRVWHRETHHARGLALRDVDSPKMRLAPWFPPDSGFCHRPACYRLPG